MNFLDEPKIRWWKELIESSGCSLNRLEPLNLLHRQNGELLFGLCDADVTDPDGRKLPRYILVRGNACLIVPLLFNRDTGEERFLMIYQRRIGNGQLCLEFPAGMVDLDNHDPLGVATRELEEETGLELKRDDLFALHKGELYSSAGLCDEGIFYFGTIISMSDDEFKAFEGRITGEPVEGEHIVVTLCTKERLLAESNSLQALLGLHLFEVCRTRMV